MSIRDPIKFQRTWRFHESKSIKIIGKGRLCFQRKANKYMRSVTITQDGFNKMEDVSLIPGARLELEPNIILINYGTRIHLIKYCLTRDGKRCEGGFFYFTPKEWQTFWNDMYKAIEKEFHNSM